MELVLLFWSVIIILQSGSLFIMYKILCGLNDRVTCLELKEWGGVTDD